MGLDLETVLSARVPDAEGLLVCKFGAFDEIVMRPSCQMCQFWGHMARETYGNPLIKATPNDNSTSMEFELRAFSAIRLGMDKREMRGGARHRLERNMRDSVLLGVVKDGGNIQECWYKGGLCAEESTSPPRAETILKSHKVNPLSINYGQIQSWIEYCQDNHGKVCPSTPRTTIRNLKLLDCVSHDVVDARGPYSHKYAALSYVWGQSASAQEVPFGSNSNALPLTVKDAVAVARALGYRYLWIDRYCIPQSDSEEKQIQIAQMDTIYANAEVTIIAAAGNGPSYGLPGVSCRERKQQLSIKIGDLAIRSTLPDGRYAVEESRWNERGWTYQEAILSRRRLVFTDYQVYFQCNGMHCCEAITKSLDQLHVKSKGRMKAWNGDGPFPAGGLGRHPWEVLDRISEFTARKLTYQSDVLNAMCGILNAFEHIRHPVRHHYGVPCLPPIMNTQTVGAAFGRLISLKPLSENPSHGFATGLCWHLERPAERRPKFPSWSWAGWQGTVGKQVDDRLRYYFGFPDGSLDVEIWAEGNSESLVRIGDILTRSWSGDVSPRYYVLHIEAPIMKLTFRYHARGLTGLCGRESPGPLNHDTGFYGEFILNNSPRQVAYSYLVLTADLLADSDFHQRLLSETWMGIVFGEPALLLDRGRSRGAFVLVVGLSNGKVFERVGHLNLADCWWNGSTTNPGKFYIACRKQTIQLQ